MGISPDISDKQDYQQSWNRQKIAIAILTIVYAVGITGMLIPLHPEFIRLTPINLLFSMGLVLYFHQPRDAFFFVFLLICFLVGFLFEVIGVQTGWIFGGYSYGTILGPKFLGTPWMIGINWIMVTYCAGMSVGLLVPTWSKGVKAVLSALLMVLLDLLMEPVAIRQGFWSWDGQEVPLQNYLAWFFIGLSLQILFHFRLQYLPNFVSVALLILQFLFFGTLYLFA